MEEEILLDDDEAARPSQMASLSVPDGTGHDSDFSDEDERG